MDTILIITAQALVVVGTVLRLSFQTGKMIQKLDSIDRRVTRLERAQNHSGGDRT